MLSRSGSSLTRESSNGILQKKGVKKLGLDGDEVEIVEISRRIAAMGQRKIATLPSRE